MGIGRSCLSLRSVTASGEVKEFVFRITRMRCWRIMKGEQCENQQLGMMKPESTKLELSFEYLTTPDSMEWVSVVSSQAILMSMCLQSMVEELVRIRAGESEPGRITRCSSKKSRVKHQDSDQSPEAGDGCGASQLIININYFFYFPGPVDYTVRKLAEKFSVVNMKSASKAAEDVFVENEVFNTSEISEESVDDDHE